MYEDYNGHLRMFLQIQMKTNLTTTISIVTMHLMKKKIMNPCHNKTFAFSMSPRLIGWNVVIPFHKNLCQQCHMIPCAEVISSWPRCHNTFFVPWNQIGKLANFKIIDIDINLKSSILSRNGWKMYHQVEWVFFIQVQMQTTFNKWHICAV